MSGQDASQSPSSNDKSSEYVVVARRYRPASFEQLIGQQHVARALSRAIETQRVGHAYLFTGARGVGKTSTARILAKSLNCVHGPTPTPCHECEICQGIASGDDVDVLEIDGASNRGIDEIRQLRQNANVRPSRARFKIYIIDEVHMLTKEAFNALLKTLEEPPEHVKFIFATTEANKIPITILSRCQRFDFAGIDTAEISQRLKEIATAEGVGIDEEALQILSRRAAGSMRDSQSLLEQLLACGLDEIKASDVHSLLGTAPETRLIKLVEALANKDAKTALSDVDVAIREGVEVAQLIDQLLGLFRDMMATSVGCDGSQLLNVATKAGMESITGLSQQLGLETILAALQVLEQTSARMRGSLHSRALAEMALVRVAHLERLDDLSALIEAVQSGEPLSIPAGSATRADSSSDLKKNGRVAAPERQVESAPVSEIRSADTSPPTEEGAYSVESYSSEDAGYPSGNSTEDSKSDLQATPSSPAQTSGNGKGLTKENAEQVWQEALHLIEGIVADQASLCRSVANTAPNHLVVSFGTKYNFYKDSCERPEQKSQLEAALAEVTGQKIRLDFVVVADGAEQRAEAPRPKSVSLRQLQSEVVSRPFVKKALELFEADQPRIEAPDNS